MSMLRNSGRVLLTLAGVATIVGPIRADWNRTHVFNERWPSHARFHGIVSLGMAAALSAFAIWRLWSRSPDPAAGRAVAAAVPLAYWGSFFPAALVPGSGVDDPPHPVPRVGGVVPINVAIAAATTLLAAAGWALDRRLRG
jgi:hypothetical protein